MNRTRIYIFLAVASISLIVTSVILYPLHSDKINNLEIDDRDNEEIFPESINNLITNENSNLQETKKLDQQIEKFIKTWHIKGASIAVLKDEKLVFAKGYGWADQERDIKTDVKHIFRIASVSKLITAATIMKLIEEGKLNMNSKVFGRDGILKDSQYLNISDKRIIDITIEHLLRHKAGFSRRYGDPLFSTLEISRRIGIDTPPSKEQVIAYAVTKRLNFTPGSGTRYSNLGYVILSEVIEKVTGIGYEKFVKDSILNPAGCYDMHLARNEYTQRFPNEVRYYEPDDQELVKSFDGSGRMVHKCYGGTNIEGLYGAGGWVASPSELVKFIASIDNHPQVPDILSKKSIEIMVESGPDKLPIGWAKTYKGGDWVRTGTLSGTSAMLRHQKDGYTWVFITNTSSWKGSDFSKLIDGFFKKEIKKVSIWPDRDLFEELTGK